jgi:hypothetical protein
MDDRIVVTKEQLTMGDNMTAAVMPGRADNTYRRLITDLDLAGRATA